ncbi:glycosyltransferase family 4 protein [Pseudooceanicola sp. LIPI14-2-Ac024]|uniref:glycosyltransferase family 4 protein n=1 Tax=Pseudooceanicola sp. LIPI14-2-Ac024 TaxID=3344875 RepID=UPI0035CF2903
MKVVHVSPYPMSRPGGVQSNVRDLCAWLESAGHGARVVSPEPPGTEAGPGALHLGRAREVVIHGTGFEFSFASPAALRRAARELRDWGADILHLHTPWTPMMPWQLWRRMGLPTVATFHATLPETDSPGLEDRYIARAARRYHAKLDALIVPSAAPQAQWARLGLDPLPEILPPTIDLSDWRAGDTGGARRPGPFRVAYLGRFEARKGVDVLIEAWNRRPESLRDAELVLAGRGDLPAPLPEGARLVPSPDRAEAIRLIADADVSVAPAGYGESFGLVLIEAMAAGTVPVAAANAGYATVMTGEGAALTFPPGDADALAARLAGLAGDPARLARLTDWARGHAMEFDVSRVGPRYLEVYDRVLSARS